VSRVTLVTHSRLPAELTIKVADGVVVTVVGVVMTIAGFCHYRASYATFLDMHWEPPLRVSSVMALHH